MYTHQSLNYFYNVECYTGLCASCILQKAKNEGKNDAMSLEKDNNPDFILTHFVFSEHERCFIFSGEERGCK